MHTDVQRSWVCGNYQLSGFSFFRSVVPLYFRSMSMHSYFPAPSERGLGKVTSHDTTVCPLPCILKGYLQMVAGRMNLYQRHLGDVAGTRLHENYPSPLHFRSSNEGCEIFPIPCEKGKIRILLYLRLLWMA